MHLEQGECIFEVLQQWFLEEQSTITKYVQFYIRPKNIKAIMIYIYFIEFENDENESISIDAGEI